MPSGVKKRKAAKKKQQRDPQITSSIGDKDFKTQNGTSSDSREINGTYDQHKCPDQLDANDDKFEKKDPNASPVLSTVEEDKSLDRETIQENKETVHELGFDDNGAFEDENELISKNNAGRSISSEYTNLGSLSKENEDRVVAVTTERSWVSSSMTKQGSKYPEGKTFSSSYSPAVGASKDDAATKDSEIPSLASAPIVAQRTSIFNCCGLFDLLRGSN